VSDNRAIKQLVFNTCSRAGQKQMFCRPIRLYMRTIDHSVTSSGASCRCARSICQSHFALMNSLLNTCFRAVQNTAVLNNILTTEWIRPIIIFSLINHFPIQNNDEAATRCFHLALLCLSYKSHCIFKVYFSVFTFSFTFSIHVYVSGCFV